MQNTLELFWFTTDSSGLPHEGFQFFFHDICRFFVCIADISHHLFSSSRNQVIKILMMVL